jgi:hypothetical protein
VQRIKSAEKARLGVVMCLLRRNGKWWSLEVAFIFFGYGWFHKGFYDRQTPFVSRH